MGGDPGRAVAFPSVPEESTIRGSMAVGIRNFASSGPSHPIAASTRAVTAALVASVTCRASLPAAAPPERVQATQLSTVPKQSSPCSARDRSGSTSSRMAMTLVAEAFGASRIPSACSTRQVPTVRRSCQPMPGATGFPGGALPHNARRPLVGDPDPRHRARRRRARHGQPPGRHRPCAAASNSTRPGAGESGNKGTRCSCSTVASGRTMAARTPDVPTSTTRMLPPPPLMSRAPVRRARRDRTFRG